MALYEEFEPRPNRLIDAQSAYLRSAAYQPIGWFEFGPEAFEEAKRADKPILLDIGAIWCHWCHVIDQESYDDPEISILINENFIPVKVDRDERPDIDARYQTAVQVLTGTGGWPLTVFLTPEGTPFFGGTYFPPEDRGDHVGFKTLLPRLAETYKNRREELLSVARALAERVEHVQEHESVGPEVSEELFNRLADGILRRFNPDQGGFERSGPKFPHPAAVELALQQWDWTGDIRWRVVVERTLLAMGLGGIYDQLGGGFHRYSTDDDWTVPHFEKMSYDNALLLENYVHASRALGVEFFHVIADGTLEYIMRELRDVERGGFYSSQDADNSPHDDGNYWTWTLDEFTAALSPEEAAVLVPYYGVRRRGDMPETGRNVLHVAESAERIANTAEAPVEEVHRLVASGKRKLLQARLRRKAPRIDTTKYANWNALLISACLEAGTLLEHPEATAFALRTARILIDDAYDEDHGMYHAFHTGEGARFPGLLEDQAYMAKALLDAFAAGGDRAFLDAARRLLDLCIKHYWDDEHGGFQDVDRRELARATTPYLRHPRKVIEDMPTPSANAVAALALDRLWVLTGEERYHEYAGRALKAFSEEAPGYGPFVAAYGLAMWYHLHPPVAATIVGDPNTEDTKRLWTAALSTYRPGRLVAVFPPDAADLKYPPIEGGAAAYVCADRTCAPPTADVNEVQKLLQTFGKPRQQ
ncbi:MAG: thioredoxin domain-containing protein [Armatimonadota bacterium]